MDAPGCPEESQGPWILETGTPDDPMDQCCPPPWPAGLHYCVGEQWTFILVDTLAL